jgi:outer membrane receptor for Fe3+-dicitrate
MDRKFSCHSGQLFFCGLGEKSVGSCVIRKVTRGCSDHGFFDNEAELGLRAHYEERFRRQINGKSPKPRSGDLAEDNERFVDAYSGFIQNRFIFGDFSFTPGVRVESMVFERRSQPLK